MSTILLLLLVVVGLVLLGWFAVELAHRRPAIGVFLLFGWLGLSVYFVATPEIFTYNLGGINVVVPDVICAFLAVTASLRLGRRFQILESGVQLPLLIFSALLGLSYLRGLTEFGLQHATNEFREFFYFLTALAYALSFKPVALAAKMPRLGLIGAGLLVLVALARLPTMDGFGLEDRVVPSYACLAMGQAFFLGWCLAPHVRHPLGLRLLALFFLLFSLLMLHRSVWLCLMGGIAALALADEHGRKKLFESLAIGLVLGAVTVVLFLGPKIVAGLEGAVQETSSEKSTFLWRLEGWVALLRPPAGWNTVDLLVGRPMGSGYSRILGNASVNAVEIESGVIPHNYYVSILLRAGVAGLIAFVWLHAILLKAMWRAARGTEADLAAICFFVILVTELIYYVPYSADMIQGLYLGSAVSLASATRLGANHEIEFLPA